MNLSSLKRSTLGGKKHRDSSLNQYNVHDEKIELIFFYVTRGSVVSENDRLLRVHKRAFLPLLDRGIRIRIVITFRVFFFFIHVYFKLNEWFVVCFSRIHGTGVQKRPGVQGHLLSDAHQQFPGTELRVVVPEIFAPTAAEILDHRQLRRHDTQSSSSR